jgi:predicted AAA+ superfamily ATPase
MMIDRSGHRAELLRKLRRNPVVGLLGARQIGKTTLAAAVARSWRAPVTAFDLEDPAHLARLADPALALRPLKGLVVLDEIQRLPDVFPLLRVLSDRRPLPARFLVLGSASPALLRQSSESLAGRISYHELPGFSLAEVGRGREAKLWLRGGFPRSFLARSDAASAEWRRDFLRGFLERELPQLGVTVPAPTLRRFWGMLAHYHGQLWNSSELASAFGVADTTVRRYLDTLTAALVVRQLPPWSENLGKRQIKTPKIYLADSGILHALLGLETQDALESHPKMGPSWEGFGIQAVVDRLGARSDECFFWGTYAGAELDLLVVRGRARLGFEFKRTVAPRVTRSMHTAIADLGLRRLDVVHAGEASFPLAPKIRALALGRVLVDLAPL